MRAARYDLPLMLAIIGGDPARFPPYVELYHRAFREFGRAGKADRRALAGLCRRHRPTGARRVVARLQADARPDRRRARLAADGARGVRQEIEHGSLYVGSPETVARKIAATAKALGISRFDLKYTARGASARQDDALHRALRPQGRSAGARHAGVKRRVAGYSCAFAMLTGLACPAVAREASEGWWGRQDFEPAKP